MMSHYVEGILRITILEASVALLICARLARADDARLQRRLDFAFRTVAVLALFSWSHFGALRGGGGLIHRWEQYHFYFGSKYLPEIKYFNLYKATILADRESAHILDRVDMTRDLTNFELQPLKLALADAAAVRGAFSDERWRAFVADWATLARGGADWTHIITDHGNSGSPAWALFAAPIARLTGITLGGQQAMGLVDIALMIVLFAFVLRTFGTRAGCVMLTVWSMVPFCFDYLAGSLLRWDWLFAVGMAVVMWRRNRPAAAGAFLGYAVMSKLFPLWFGVAFAIQQAFAFARTRRFDRRLVRFAAGGAIAVVLSVALSSAMFGGFGIWKSYKERIGVAAVEKYYPNQYSFRTVFLQFYESSPKQVIDGWAFPREIKQARVDVDIGKRRVPFFLCQLVLTALAAAALAFSDEIEALSVGPLLVYVWLMVNAYYWNMLALPALAWAVREFEGRRGRLVPLVGLHVVFAWFYVYQHFNAGFSEGYFVGLLLCGLLVIWSISAVVVGRKKLGTN